MRRRRSRRSEGGDGGGGRGGKNGGRFCHSKQQRVGKVCTSFSLSHSFFLLDSLAVVVVVCRVSFIVQ